MAYNVKPPKVNYESPEDGTHGARLYGIAHLGHQDTPWGSQERLMLTFELDAYMADGRPFVVSDEYNFTFNDGGKLLPVVEALVQRTLTEAELDEFDIAQLSGKAALVSVKKTDKGFPKVTAVSRLPRGMAVPTLVNTPWFWWLAEGGFDPKAFGRAPKWIQDKAMKSPEYKALSSPGSAPTAASAPPPSPAGNGGAAAAVKAKGKGKAKAAEPRGQSWGKELDDEIPFGD